MELVQIYLKVLWFSTSVPYPSTTIICDGLEQAAHYPAFSPKLHTSPNTQDLAGLRVKVAYVSYISTEPLASDIYKDISELQECKCGMVQK
jgi:hypothetical protein